ncbi:hypothetical protein Tdes44962_MAKER03156 [Teratosphaeria destructans]|uniref:Uncharacterized protein n=1 Tax=Teratosphaeria destructans TaxID=418781 RepID=A0A9W7W266_9PEZI|nr:hypothetical protein Tdes44962_MAKER03156 [Teratosphaeria destructans]
MAPTFENLSPQDLCTSKPIKWSPPTTRRILIFCAQNRLSQRALEPHLLGRLMVKLGWGDVEKLSLPAYTALAKRVARYITTYITAEKLHPAFTETRHDDGSWTVTWRAYTAQWDDGYAFDRFGTDPPPAGDDGAERESVTRESEHSTHPDHSIAPSAHPVLLSIAICIASHNSTPIASALDWLLHNPFAPTQVSDALKASIAANLIFEQGASVLRAKDFEIHALQERARSSVGVEEIGDFVEELRGKEARIETLSLALEREQRENSEIGELKVRIQGLESEGDMLRSALCTTQQDVQAKEEGLRDGMEENKRLVAELEAARARVGEMDALTVALHSARRAAIEDQRKLSEQGEEIEMLQAQLAAMREERERVMEIVEDQAGKVESKPRDDSKTRAGLQGSIWALSPRSSRHSMQQRGACNDTPTSTTSPQPKPATPPSQPLHQQERGRRESSSRSVPKNSSISAQQEDACRMWLRAAV